MPYVALDYGHGSDTFDVRGSKGVIVDGVVYEEHSFNADVGEQVRLILEDHGFKVLVTQPPNQPDVGLEYRTDLANREDVEAFISFHANAGVPAAQGACVFAWEGYSGANRLADYVVDEFQKAGIDTHGNGRHYSQFYYPGTDNWHWTNFHVLRETNMSAILIEHGFMTNERDFENIFGSNSVEYRRKCAIADAKAILRHFGVAYKGEDYDKGYLAPGDSGEAVKTLQRRLTKLGYYDLAIDGHYGPGTEQAVKEFQADYGLTVDGYYGPATEQALDEAVHTYSVAQQQKQQEEINLAETGFKDVQPDKYYTKAIEWAKEQGITEGIGNDEFGVGEFVTREDAIVFLYRAFVERD